MFEKTEQQPQEVTCEVRGAAYAELDQPTESFFSLLTSRATLNDEEATTLLNLIKGDFERLCDQVTTLSVRQSRRTR